MVSIFIFWEKRSYFTLIKRYFSFVLLLTCFFSAPLVSAFELDRVYFLQIPASKASIALKDLARQTKYSLLFQNTEIESIMTNGIKGNYTLKQALSLLLKGTHLSGGVTERKVITIARLSQTTKLPEDSMGQPSKTTFLSSLVGLFTTIFGSSTVVAAEEPVETESAQVITITGIRGSVVKSLNTKRNAESIVDAITAEDIGKFPDQNVAESLQRITGVSITRAFGEGERVSIRGTTDSQNRTLLNGQAVGSVDWWTGSAASRGFNYTMLPSEIVSDLEVYKSPQADLDEGSIGGTIIVRTRKPLDLDSKSFFGSAMGQYSELSGEVDPQLSGLYSWKNESETFGALVSLISQQRNLRRDGIEAWSWANKTVTLENGTTYDNVYAPGGGGSAMFLQDRQRTGITATFQFEPSDSHSMVLNIVDNTLKLDNENQNFLWLVGYGDSQYTEANFINNNVVGQVLVGGTLGLSPTGNNVLDETKVRNSEMSTQVYDFKYEHFGDIWTSSIQLGLTESEGGTQADRSVGWEGNTIHRFSAATVKSIETSYDLEPANGANWDLGFLRYDSNDAKDEENYFQADFFREINLSIFSQLKFGLKHRDHSRFNTKLTTDSRTDLGWNLADYSLPMPSDFLSGQGSAGTLRNYAITNSDQIRGEGDALVWDYRVLKASTFDINEKILAGYFKMNIEADDLRGDIGVRLVKTKQTSGAYQGASGSEVWVEENKTYSDILPSLNLMADLTEDVVVRFAAARVMSRPDYNAMTAFTSYNTETQTGTGGNPEIDAFRATQFDFGVEWYFDEAALLSAVYFHKDVLSFLDNVAGLEMHEGVEILINRPTNGRSGTIQGLEFGYQQEIYEGLGVLANYTFVDGEAKGADGNNTTIPGNSKHTLNLSAYYEQEVLSGRISYNYRSGYESGTGWPGYVDDYAQVDANLTYKLNEQISFVLEGINLTDEYNFTYQQEGVKNALTGLYRNGRRYLAGVRANF
ncbi:TonB-dependent receptor [Aliikangiella sp. IMCC44359]|uniref:TonB-dependent receptor n=1 Tax=Aliikangiella sp. IMCC44359 TaxID=3459125 RepID=UPI00403AB034